MEGADMIERREYLEDLMHFKDKSIIKVVAGIRRCGKSTLFQLICGLLNPTNGTIFIDDEDIFQYCHLKHFLMPSDFPLRKPISDLSPLWRYHR